MPYRRPEAEEALKRAIRDTRAVDPLITQTKLLTTLEKKFDRTFAPAYVRRLSEKVARQVRLEADFVAIEARLSTIRESFRLGRERLLRIIYWTHDDKDIKQPYAEEIVKAVAAIVQLDLALLDAELNAGLYKKNEDQIIEELRYKPLAPEIREQIVSTFQRWGRLPDPVVERIVPSLPVLPEPAHGGAAA